MSKCLPVCYFHGENSVGTRTLLYPFAKKEEQSRTKKKKKSKKFLFIHVTHDAFLLIS